MLGLAFRMDRGNEYNCRINVTGGYWTNRTTTTARAFPEWVHLAHIRWARGGHLDDFDDGAQLLTGTVVFGGFWMGILDGQAAPPARAMS